MKRVLVVVAFLAILFSSVTCFAQPQVSGFWSGKLKSFAGQPARAISGTFQQLPHPGMGSLVLATLYIWSEDLGQNIVFPAVGSCKANGFLGLSGYNPMYFDISLSGWVVGNVLAGGYQTTANGELLDHGPFRMIFRY